MSKDNDGFLCRNSSDSSIRKIQLRTDTICYGPEPNPNDEIEQRLTITADGRVWLSRYRYGTGYNHEFIDKSCFRVASESAKDIFDAIENVFNSDYEMYFVTDVGSWLLTITDTDGHTFEIPGSLCYDAHSKFGRISDLIRIKLGMTDLFLFDGRES